MRKILEKAICLAFCFVHFANSENTKLTEVFAWKVVDYAWGKPEDRDAAIKSGEFVPSNNLPLGLEVWKNKLFVTVPRWKNGVVSTLNYINLDEYIGRTNSTEEKATVLCPNDKCEPSSPALVPYPSFEANRVTSETKTEENSLSDKVTSVFRVRADACDRLWVMDTGISDILGNTTVVSKPRILIYDLNNDSLMKAYEFKNSDAKENSFFANIIVDVEAGECDKAFAYVPDLGEQGIVVYDLAKDKSWRLKHNFFHFDPLAGNMMVGGVNFQWTDGVFSIALTKRKEDGFRTAYFHALASTKEFKVDTKVLQAEDPSKTNYYDYSLVGDRGENSQSTASFIHEDTGVLFYTQLQKDGINCWNTNKELTLENIVEVASDNETMIFPNDLKVDRNGNLWLLTDRLPTFIYKGLDDSEVNYRIFRAPVQQIIAGTNCDTVVSSQEPSDPVTMMALQKSSTE